MESFFKVQAFIFGLLVGSFLNVIIIRLPQKKDWIRKSSACPQCGTSLHWYHNIPVISFLFLRGQCAFCGKKISWRYPLIELLTGFFAFWLFPTEVDASSLGMFFFYFSVACVFLCHLVIDLDHHLLLDSLNLYLLAMILPFSVLTYHWTHWLIGGGVGFGVPLLVTWLFYKFRGQVGLGGGDIKLFGILGLLFGPAGIMFTLFLSCFVGSIIGVGFIVLKKMSKEKPMAFGPAIILVAALQIYFPHAAAYLQSLLF